MNTPADYLTTHQTPLQRSCKECGQTFEVPPFRMAELFVHQCPDCTEKQIKEETAEALARSGSVQVEAWKRFCPPLFLDTDPARLPKPAKLDQVLEWTYGPKGLTLHGNSGTGKSRIAWQLLKREFLSGRSVAAIDATFGYDYSSKFSISPAEAARYVEHKTLVDLLLMDDVLKVRLTDSVEQALFAIVNSRTEKKLPIVFTTNDTGDTLRERMSDDRGPALLRRLREFSTIISFA